MKKELKRRWVEALTSGKYRQGKGNLKWAGRYCCLGVLRETNNPDDTMQYFGMLTDEQLEEFGLTREQHEYLADMNDFGVPFEVIAGFIQEYL